MPGVPPDAVDRLKKGLKGLFNKNKKTKETDKHPAESSKTEAPKPTETKPEEPKPAETSQPSEPATGSADESKKGMPTQNHNVYHCREPPRIPRSLRSNFQLPTIANAHTPDAPTASEPSNVEEPVKPEEAGTAVKDADKAEGVGSKPPEAKPAANPEGMSATSGPLGDDPEFAHAGSS
ncbi:MAG: hypothetical protein M1820_004507 [Bogoriella megaspora]|nr:MAG: hypothetical protein M1820_004507 [Bogoriella megaspora]